MRLSVSAAAGDCTPSVSRDESMNGNAPRVIETGAVGQGCSRRSPTRLDTAFHHRRRPWSIARRYRWTAWRGGCSRGTLVRSNDAPRAIPWSNGATVAGLVQLAVRALAVKPIGRELRAARDDEIVEAAVTYA